MGLTPPGGLGLFRDSRRGRHAAARRPAGARREQFQFKLAGVAQLSPPLLPSSPLPPLHPQVWAATADINRATADGTTALMAAAQAGRTPVVQMLLRKGAAPSLANAKGQRALELALAGKHSEVIELLQPLTPGAPPPPR